MCRNRCKENFMLNISNILTLSRIVFTPLVMYFVYVEYYSFALYSFIIISLTDAFDGHIARRYNQVTMLGEYLDPIADKFMILGICIVLVHNQLLPLWFVALIAIRELVILLGVVCVNVLKYKIKIKVIITSKINTVLLITLITFILYNNIANSNINHYSNYIDGLIYSSVIMTMLSGATYFYNFIRKLSYSGK